ncbi:hypothetical protein [Sphingomonas jatrophae]|uniref:Uncharacterized protein n=1 Tax=Sphingomonas jatrophae TaxID=1166337 RepID=A0A1I6JLD9_9SPHN|nr:hypothetical protein [Sphingomonas jatrophae]SFR79803.1 hypothetical protein SAMN05192580_0464 [Sphingomonas jatrophae]
MTIDKAPPPDLRGCADRPAPLPEDAVAILPAPLRVALIALAGAFAANAARLDRLVDWHDPDAHCATPAD